MHFFEETIEVKEGLHQFLDFLNPHLYYSTIKYLYCNELRELWMFEKAEFNEIMMVPSSEQLESGKWACDLTAH